MGDIRLNWWGKLIGGAFGFILGGPLGAVLGIAVGHNLDSGMEHLSREPLAHGDQERVQTAFFAATFSTLGSISKADGKVSPQEILLAEEVMRQMDLSSEMKTAAIRLFNEGKSKKFPLDEAILQFKKECKGRTTLIQMFLEIQIQGAYADGKLDKSEESLLLHICSLLKVSESEFRRLERRIQVELGLQNKNNTSLSVNDCYALLGVKKGDSDVNVKKAYRRLLNQHHPDKLASKGLPEEMMKLAAQKTHEIRQAYQVIKNARNF